MRAQFKLSANNLRSIYSDDRRTFPLRQSSGDLEREVNDSAAFFIVTLHQVPRVPLVAIEAVGAVEVLLELYASIERDSGG